MVILYTLPTLTTSCSFEDEPRVCPQNVKLEYWYAGYASQNNLALHVDRLQEYLYDGRGQLLRIRTLQKDSLTGKREILPPGDYKIVVWGNYSPNVPSASQILQAETLSQAKLSALQDTIPPRFRENTEKLYYGSGFFTVPEKGTVNKRIHLSHAHAALKISVSWLTDRPTMNEPLTMRLRGVPCQYGFSVGREIATGSEAGPHQVPTIGVSDIQYRIRVAIDYTGDVVGEFTTFRYTANTHPLWSLYCGERQLIKELDLWRYFQKSAVDLDHNVEQEFHLTVIVEPGQIVVREISGADWSEGGTIG